MKDKYDNLAIARARRKPSVGNRFNPDMLATVRYARSLSQAALAEAMQVKISQALIGKWEAGLSAPNNEQVKALAATLAIEPELLFVDRPRRLASMSDFYHRALAKARRADVKAIQARCSIIDLQVDRLLELAELPEDRIPDIDPRGHAGDVEKVAMAARTAMRVEPGPLKNLVEIIELCGGLVIDRELEVNNVDALCRWVPELPKLFFINGGRPADRMRFSLAHELGHTIMHFGRDLDPTVAEKQANGFASAFLLPAQDFHRDLKSWVSLADLAALKRKWRVSMQAIARRARSLNVIDDSRYRSICIQISQKGWRKTEPVAIDGESPRRFTELLRAHLEAGYSRDDLARLLFVSRRALDEMIDDAEAPTWEDEGVRLRLVR